MSKRFFWRNTDNKGSLDKLIKEANVPEPQSIEEVYAEDAIDFTDPRYYENRELSWLKFNQRILNETSDDDNPLMEKLGFLSITSSFIQPSPE